MVSINYAFREIHCKIVYYGPGLSGKTTNLQYVHKKVPPQTKGELISLATDADRTLYFDFLPINIGSVAGFTTKFQLYTVPGQVYYNATRKLVLRGVDGLVFVADSQKEKMEENVESLQNLKDNLAEYGYDPEAIPLVFQYNKRDLPSAVSLKELSLALNSGGQPEFEAVAPKGIGVFDTLKCITKLVLDRARAQTEKADIPQAASQPIVTPKAVPAPPIGIVTPSLTHQRLERVSVSSEWDRSNAVSPQSVPDSLYGTLGPAIEPVPKLTDSIYRDPGRTTGGGADATPFASAVQADSRRAEAMTKPAPTAPPPVGGTKGAEEKIFRESGDYPALAVGEPDDSFRKMPPKPVLSEAKGLAVSRSKESGVAGLTSVLTPHQLIASQKTRPTRPRTLPKRKKSFFGRLFSFFSSRRS